MSYSDVYDFKNLLNVGLDCCKGGRWKYSIQAFEMTLLRNTAANKKKLESGKYKPKKTNNFKLCERGKWRDIKAHHITDRQVYKSFCNNELDKVIKNQVLENNSASQVGKGTDHSIRLFRKGLTKAYRKFGRDFYVVTADYHNYFGSIVHDKVSDIIHLSDEQSANIMTQYIDIFDGNIGIGIGGEPSQKISVVYPSKIDRTLACDKRVISSGRYMDDIFVICHLKSEAQDILKIIINMSNGLGLQLNMKRTKISYMQKDSVVWLKKRTHLTESGKIIMELTRKNVRDEVRNIKRQKEQIENGERPLRSAFESIQCWSSYAVKYNSRQQMMRAIKFFMEQFNVPWDIAKKLFKKKNSGFIKACVNRSLI